MGHPFDLTGRKFKRLEVISIAVCPVHVVIPKQLRLRWWNCRCECGAEIVRNSEALLGKHTGSCGCLARDIKRAALAGLRERRRILWEEKKRLLAELRAANPTAPKPLVARAGSSWTPELLLQLRELWTQGHSTAEIGRRMGFSKNAIVGKAHRLDLDARPSPIRRDAPTALRPIPSVPRIVRTLPPLPSELTAGPPAPRPAPAPRAVVVRPVLAAEPVRLDRRRTCESLSGERRKMVACGKPVVLGKSYCPECCAIMFIPQRHRREAA